MFSPILLRARNPGPMTGSIWKVSGGSATMVAEGIGRPRGLALLDGKLAVSDYQHHVVSLVDKSSGAVTPIAGTWDGAGMVDGAASNESADMISEMHSAWHTHRAVKGAGAVAVEDVVRWASAHGARVLGFEDGGVIAPGKLADLAIFDLSHPRYFGLHDPLIGPVACAGDAHLRHLIVGGRIVVSDGTIPGIDLAQLRHDAARVVTRLAS